MKDFSSFAEGKFFSSGSIFFDAKDGMYKDSRLLADGNPLYRSAYFDLLNHYGLSYTYKSDDLAYLYARDTTLRIGLDKSLAFLLKDDRDFLIDCARRAKLKFNEKCGHALFSVFLIAAPAPTETPAHRHSEVKNHTFTYVISSLNNRNSSSFVINEVEQKFPDCNEFFFFFDSSQTHATKRLAGDQNTYLFFIFDGVENKSDLEENVFYEV